MAGKTPGCAVFGQGRGPEPAAPCILFSFFLFFAGSLDWLCSVSWEASPGPPIRAVVLVVFMGSQPFSTKPIPTTK